MTFDEYIIAVDDRYVAEQNWRWGQTAFNVLDEQRPDLAAQIRGGPQDPFHLPEGDNDEPMIDFFEWVEVHWDDPPGA